MQLVGKVETGENRDPSTVSRIASLRDVSHQVVDLFSRSLYLHGITIREQSVRLIEDVNANGLLGHRHRERLSSFYAEVRIEAA